LGTDGGTELRPALKHVLEVAAKHSPNQFKNLIVITDAQVGNECAILELMKTAHDIPVHCFGIDVALNDSLLLALCRQQGGTFHSLNPKDDIEQAVTALGKTLGQPVLLDLRLSEGWELAEPVIPNLYAGQIHYLSARSSGDRPLELYAKTATCQSTTIRFDSETAGFDAPCLHWCRSRIRHLVEKGDDTAAVALSIQSNLICPLTAFIAWDESEKVPIATHELVQPGSEPFDLFFGLEAKWCDASDNVIPQGSRRTSLLSRLIRGDSKPAQFFQRNAAESLHARRAAGPPDELILKRELSNLCHKAGIADWQVMLKAIFDWIAEANGTERAQRVDVLNQFVEEVRIHSGQLELARTAGTQSQADEAGERIRKLLKAFVAVLPMKNKTRN
jgi:hypothetical protein